MPYKRGNIVRHVEKGWGSLLGRGGKLCVIEKVSSYKNSKDAEELYEYAVMDIEDGAGSAWYRDKDLEFVADGSEEEVKKCEERWIETVKREEDLNYIKEIFESKSSISCISMIKLFHEIGYKSVFENNGEYYALFYNWEVLKPIFIAIFDQDYDGMIKAVHERIKEEYVDKYLKSTRQLYEKINRHKG